MEIFWEEVCMVRNTVKNGESWCLMVIYTKQSTFDVQFHLIVVTIFLRTVPTIVTVHIFCECLGSRTRCERNAQHTGHRLVLSPVSLGGSSHFLWKRCAMFNRWKIISISLVSSLKTEEVCACCYFCRIINLTENFIVKYESILKHKKLLLQDVKLGAWVLKNPLIGKDQ